MSKRLKKIQRKFRDSRLEQLNLDGTWEQWLPRPLKPADSTDNLFHVFDVDRFLSIYNRPVRRRQISHEPGSEFPESGVIRNPADGTLYILGADRTDTDGNITVETLTTLHQVDETCQVTRRQLSGSATEDDPGWLEVVTVGEYYFDSELRTVTEESELAGEFVGKYFTFTNCNDLRPNDVITFPDGETYLVEMPYKDAGFNSARVANMKDYRQDIVFTQVTATTTSSTGGYNPYDRNTTGTSQDGMDFNVTAWIGKSMSQPTSESVSINELDVFIDDEAIGVRPTTSDKITVSGDQWSVEEVRYNYTFDQYELKCSRL